MPIQGPPDHAAMISRTDPNIDPQTVRMTVLEKKTSSQTDGPPDRVAGSRKLAL